MFHAASRLIATATLYVLCAGLALADSGGDDSNPYVKMTFLSPDTYVLNTPSEQIPGFSVRLTNAQGQPLPGLTVSIFTDVYFCMNEAPYCTNPSPDLFGAFVSSTDGQYVTDADGTVTTPEYRGGTVPGNYDVYAGVFSLMSEKNAAALHNTMGPGAKFDIRQTFEATGYPGGYLSGNWFAPSLGGGTGFQLEFTDAIDSASGKPIALAIWFAYTPNGTGEQSWIYAQGTYDPAVAVVDLPAVVPSGARFPPAFNSADVRNAPWGRLTFAFSDCDNGVVTWSSFWGYSPEPLPIRRLTKIAGTTCPP
jgi:hypothetical protein